MPDRIITRTEMAVMISRIVNLEAVKPSSAPITFTDISESYAANHIQAVAKADIIQGRTSQQYEPEAASTRAEALTVILNALKLSPELRQLLEPHLTPVKE